MTLIVAADTGLVAIEAEPLWAQATAGTAGL